MQSSWKVWSRTPTLVIFSPILCLKCRNKLPGVLNRFSHRPGQELVPPGFHMLPDPASCRGVGSSVSHPAFPYVDPTLCVSSLSVCCCPWLLLPPHTLPLKLSLCSAFACLFPSVSTCSCLQKPRDRWLLREALLPWHLLFLSCHFTQPLGLSTALSAVQAPLLLSRLARILLELILLPGPLKGVWIFQTVRVTGKCL